MYSMRNHCIILEGPGLSKNNLRGAAPLPHISASLGIYLYNNTYVRSYIITSFIVFCMGGSKGLTVL